MDHWVMCHHLNLLSPKWQNNMENHLMIGPKMGFISASLWYPLTQRVFNNDILSYTEWLILLLIIPLLIMWWGEKEILVGNKKY